MATPTLITGTVPADSPPTTPWVPIAAALTGAILGALTAAIVSILDGDTARAWAAATAMVLLGLLLFPVVARAEREADR
ncbi:hypothetical protein [Micromonospora echinospora]|uniref:hypothetical protein n=1 Tax=Micromonospora echinospora TaxID=1877 RepID=UPI003A8779C7